MSQLDHIRAFFDGLAPVWDQNCHHDANLISALLTVAACPRGGRILDVACGTGVLLPHLLGLEPEHIAAIDLSPEMVSVAAQKFDDPRLHIFCADFYTLDAAPFNLITVYSAYPHFFDKDAFALRAAALLKPGGRIVIAHSQSKEAINARHGGSAQPVSVTLRDAETEASPLRPYFHMDTLVDNDSLYLLSGKRREGAL